jgi:hypothetical protein
MSATSWDHTGWYFEAAWGGHEFRIVAFVQLGNPFGLNQFGHFSGSGRSADEFYEGQEVALRLRLT